MGPGTLETLLTKVSDTSREAALVAVRRRAVFVMAEGDALHHT
jgi:hypothetical protein